MLYVYVYCIPKDVQVNGNRQTQICIMLKQKIIVSFNLVKEKKGNFIYFIIKIRILACR